jgi:DNA-binding beta-propeller fold protein YncE
MRIIKFQSPVNGLILDLPDDTHCVCRLADVPDVEPLVGTVYVANDFASGPSYYVIDASDNSSVAGAHSKALYNPVANNDNTRLYVLNSTDGVVAYVDLSTGTLVNTTTPCGVFATTTSQAFVIDNAGNFGYVIDYANGRLYKMDMATGAAVATIVLGSWLPAALCINNAGTVVYVVGVDGYYVFDTIAETGVFHVLDAAGGGIRGVALNPAEDKLYVVGHNGSIHYGVYIVDTTTFALLDFVNTPGAGIGYALQMVVFNPDGLTYAVSDLNSTPDGLVWIYDAATNTLQTTIIVPRHNTVGSLAYNQTGSRLYASSGQTDTLTVIETAGYTIVATVPVPTLAIGVYVYPPA